MSYIRFGDSEDDIYIFVDPGGIVNIYYHDDEKVKEIPEAIFNNLIREWFDNSDKEDSDGCTVDGAKIIDNGEGKIRLSYQDWAVVILRSTMDLIAFNNYMRG